MCQRLTVVAALTVAMLMIRGCKQGGDPSAPPEQSVDERLTELQNPNPVKRVRAAQELAKLPQAELEKIAPNLREALKKERNRGVQQIIQRALDTVGDGGTATGPEG